MRVAGSQRQWAMEGGDCAPDDTSSGDLAGTTALLAGGGALIAAWWCSRGSPLQLRAFAVVGASALALASAAAASRRAAAQRGGRALVFVPWKELDALQEEKILVIDTTHASRECLTHHKMKYAPPASLRGDTTTAMVRVRVRCTHALSLSAPVPPTCSCRGPSRRTYEQ